MLLYHLLRHFQRASGRTLITYAVVYDRQSKQFFKETPTADKAACSISADNKGWSAEHSEVLDPEAQKRGDFKQ